MNLSINGFFNTTEQMDEEIGIGIDLGSSQVKVGLYKFKTEQLLAQREEEVRYYHESNAATWAYTQSSCEILEAIDKCFAKLKVSERNIVSCGVAATCSMVIVHNAMQKDDVAMRSHKNDVVFWMDSTAIKETQYLNEQSGSDILNALGGGFIPEMGIPKLLKLIRSTNFDNKDSITVYDLHKFMAYHIANKYGWNYVNKFPNGNLNGIGHDGELCGWNNDFMHQIVKLPQQIEIGPNTSINSNSVVEVKSCIDCYTNWFASTNIDSSSTLFAVAGTSTCYLYSTREPLNPIKGVWGPFQNLIDEDGQFCVYEAGQSWSGKLLEHLFETHPATSSLHSKNWRRLFEQVEKVVSEIELEQNRSIHYTAKNLHYYGDLNGNRTPFGDPEMTGMFIGETTDTSMKDLALKYITILEFLAFQIKLVIDLIDGEAIPSISRFVICGSQASNDRFLQLIKILNPSVDVLIPNGDVSKMGMKGAFLMGKASTIKLPLHQLCKSHNALPQLKVTPNEYYKTDKTLPNLLNAKYAICKDMATTQREYRKKIETAICDI